MPVQRKYCLGILICCGKIRPLVKWISFLSSKQAVGVRSSQGRPVIHRQYLFRISFQDTQVSVQLNNRI